MGFIFTSAFLQLKDERNMGCNNGCSLYQSLVPNQFASLRNRCFKAIVSLHDSIVKIQSFTGCNLINV